MLRGLVRQEDEGGSGQGPARAGDGSRTWNSTEAFPEWRRAEKVSFGGLSAASNSPSSARRRSETWPTLEDLRPSRPRPLVAPVMDLSPTSGASPVSTTRANGREVTPQDDHRHQGQGSTEDEIRPRMNVSGKGTDQFLKGFKEETLQLRQVQPRFHAKNSRFDTLDEDVTWSKG